jgi:hypothetical protein
LVFIWLDFYLGLLNQITIKKGAVEYQQRPFAQEVFIGIGCDR